MIFLRFVSNLSLRPIECGDFPRLSLNMKNSKLKAYWFLVGQLFRSEIVSEYKKSFLGFTWMIFLPIISVLLWVGLHTAGIVNPGDVGVSYPLYLLVSMTFWNFFTENYRQTSHTLTANAKLLILRDVPEIVLIVKQILVAAFRFSIIFLVNLILLYVYGYSLGIGLLILPIVLLPLVMLAVGLGFFIAIFRVVLVDLSTAFDELIKVLMFLTPIVYAPKIQWQVLQKIVYWNPLSYLIEACRSILFENHEFPLLGYMLSTGLSLLLALVGYVFFRKSKKRVIERLTV